MRTSTILSITSVVALLVVTVFSLAFGRGQNIERQLATPARESAPGPAPEHPPEAVPATTPPPVMLRLSQAVEQLDSKVEQLRVAVSKRRRGR